jgi:hypothetical protein
MLQSLKKLLADWPQSGWLTDDKGAIYWLRFLISQFRNRAAHIDDLSKSDYDQCFDLVIGRDGILWHFISSTEAGN